MDESSQQHSPVNEITCLLAAAIIRYKRQSQNKEAVRLDNRANPCMTVTHPEKRTDVSK